MLCLTQAMHACPISLKELRKQKRPFFQSLDHKGIRLEMHEKRQEQ